MIVEARPISNYEKYLKSSYKNEQVIASLYLVFEREWKIVVTKMEYLIPIIFASPWIYCCKQCSWLVIIMSQGTEAS